ncbi:immunoglobulin lambda-1 light chain-like isoform X2, partial [Silurus meridionalis]
CRSSQDVSADIQWHLLKPGKATELLIDYDVHQLTVVPERFSGIKSNVRKYYLKISEVQSEDAGEYYCQSES